MRFDKYQNKKKPSPDQSIRSVNSLKLNVGGYLFQVMRTSKIYVFFTKDYCRIRKKSVIPRIVKIAMAYVAEPDFKCLFIYFLIFLMSKEVPEQKAFP